MLCITMHSLSAQSVFHFENDTISATYKVSFKNNNIIKIKCKKKNNLNEDIVTYLPYMFKGKTKKNIKKVLF